MRVWDKLYILDSLGRGEKHKIGNSETKEFELLAHKVLFTLLSNEKVYSNSANLQADNYSCGSYALEIMKREIQLIKEFGSEKFNKHMVKYFNKELENVQDVSFHKSKVIGEIPSDRQHILGNIKLYAIPNELVTLAQSTSYLLTVKEVKINKVEKEIADVDNNIKSKQEIIFGFKKKDRFLCKSWLFFGKSN